MDDRWHVLTQVCDLRVRLALNEVSLQRQARSRAQGVLDQMLRRKAQYEEQATQVSGMLAAGSRSGDDVLFTAAQAQELLNYARGARLKAQETATPIRGAQLQWQRTQTAVDEAMARYRREAGRREGISSQWRATLKDAQRLRLEREEEVRAEEHAGVKIARRETEDHVGDE